MKAIFLLLIIVPCVAICQKKTGGGFESIGISMLMKDGSPSFGAAAAVGIGNNIATFGLGGELYSFKSTRSPYIPVFAHLKVYVNQNKLQPYVTLAVGHGIYSDGPKQGGLYAAASAGLHMRNIKNPKQPGIYFQAGLKHLSFRTNNGFINSLISTDYLSFDIGLRF